MFNFVWVWLKLPYLKIPVDGIAHGVSRQTQEPYTTMDSQLVILCSLLLKETH